MGDDEPAIAARDLTVRRGGSAVLDGVDLTVPSGGRVLVQGESGAGKTTLFELLGLLDVPDGGQLRVDGEDAATLGERDRARLRRDAVGIVFQDFQLVPDLTARENAALPQEHAGERDEDWLDTLFAELDIEHAAARRPATLSGGEKQRVAIARALANRPRVVLADEPTGQLDPATADAVLELLFSVQELAGTALAVVSHDRALVDEFETVYRLVDGQLVRQA